MADQTTGPQSRKNSPAPLFPSAIHPAPPSPPATSLSPKCRGFSNPDALEKRNPMRRMHRLEASRRPALLRIEHAYAHLVELAAKALGADTPWSVPFLPASKKRVPQGHRHHPQGAGRRMHHPAQPVFRRAVSAGERDRLPVLNAGDGMAEHPSQALLDLRTNPAVPPHSFVVNQREVLRGVTLTICGDILHSRVARSNALLLPRLGAKCSSAAPELLPEVATACGPGIAIERDFDAALRRSQIS